MLSRFFALYTDIYLFNRLIIILQPTGERLEWEEAQPPHSRLTPRLEADLPRINFTASASFWKNGVPANR